MIVPPALSTPIIGMPEVPCMSGAAASIRTERPASANRLAASAASAGVVGTSAPTILNVGADAVSRLECGHITPLGIPVVPPV